MPSIPLIIGHRGAPALLPEHTAQSYREAIAAGCDLVEPDVVPTRDGTLLVRHEPLLDDTTNIAAHPVFRDRRRADGWYSSDFTWDELRRLRAVERLPELRGASHAHSGRYPLLRLREVAELAVAERKGLVVEVKWDAWARREGFAYEKLLRRELLPVAEGLPSVRIESFEMPLLERLRTQAWIAETGARLIVLVEDTPLAQPHEEGPERLSDAGLAEVAARFHGISVRTSLLDARLVSRAHAHGLEVLTYTLRGETQFVPEQFAGRAQDWWRALAETGVDGVFADDPAAVRRALSGC